MARNATTSENQVAAMRIAPRWFVVMATVTSLPTSFLFARQIAPAIRMEAFSVAQSVACLDLLVLPRAAPMVVFSTQPHQTSWVVNKTATPAASTAPQEHSASALGLANVSVCERVPLRRRQRGRGVDHSHVAVHRVHWRARAVLCSTSAKITLHVWVERSISFVVCF
jgi:hypothetical protein